VIRSFCALCTVQFVCIRSLTCRLYVSWVCDACTSPSNQSGRGITCRKLRCLNLYSQWSRSQAVPRAIELLNRWSNDICIRYMRRSTYEDDALSFIDISIHRIHSSISPRSRLRAEPASYAGVPAELRQMNSTLLAMRWSPRHNPGAQELNYMNKCRMLMNGRLVLSSCFFRQFCPHEVSSRSSQPPRV